MTPINVFIGFDSRQPLAFQVAAHSVWKTSGCSVSVTRLDLRHLPVGRRGLTEFTYSRFLAPWLCAYKGMSVFLDSDVLVREDVVELLGYAMAYPKTPVFVVKGPRKFEWASLMVFNNPLCQMLTPAYVENRRLNPLAFPWAHTVGELPKEWNHLVGYDVPNPEAKLVHFTQGIPIWPETKECEFAAEWHAAAREMNSSVSFESLMGRSVHVAHMKVGA